MIIPVTADLAPIIKGTDYEAEFIIHENGVPKNLTSCTVSLVLSNIDGTVATFTAGSGLTIYATDGTIVLAINETVTSTYPEGEVLYRLTITEGAAVYRYVEGKSQVRS